MKRTIQALVIGNGAYSPNLKLDSPKNDAETVAESLRGLKVNVILGTDLGFDDIEKLVGEFITKVNLPSTTVSLLYYSGHGLQLSEQNYIVPTDFDVQADRKITKLISVQSIVEEMNSATAIRIVILDACRSNGDARQLVGGAKSIASDKGFFVNDQKLPPPGLAEMRASRDTFIAFAAAPGDVALEALPGHRLSPFTEALVNHLDVVDLPLANLTSRVRQEVLNNTGGRQRTWDQSSLLEPFYFSPDSLLVFMGNFLAIAGLIFSVLILSLVLISRHLTWPWVVSASALPVVSLAVLLYGAQSVYARLRGNTGWERNAQPPVRAHLSRCFRRGLIGGYLGSLIAAIPLSAPYYLSWSNRTCLRPDISYGQFLVEIAITTALTACILGFFSTFFARARITEGVWTVLPAASARETIFGCIVGGIVTGLIAAPLITVYFGSKIRPEFTPNFLLGGAVLGAAFIIFAIINFDFERLNARRLWTSACSSVAALIAGAAATAAVFGPFYLLPAVDALRWLSDKTNDPLALLAGGAVYGIPVGIVLGFVIGSAIVLTEKWSKKPVLS